MPLAVAVAHPKVVDAPFLSEASPPGPVALEACYLGRDSKLIGSTSLLLPAGINQILLRALPPPRPADGATSLVLNLRANSLPGASIPATPSSSTVDAATVPARAGASVSVAHSAYVARLVEESWSAHLHQQVALVHAVPDVVCAPQSPLVAIAHQLKNIAGMPLPILLVGEPGCGKSALGREIHALSGRLGLFRQENCSSYQTHSLDLIRSVLLGIGRHSGLVGVPPEGTQGLLSMLDKGTLFMDEVSRLPLAVQADLLLVLDGHSFRKAGGAAEYATVSLRFIFATNRDPLQLLNEGLLAPDFYDRIHTIILPVPPLRDRREDIPALIEHFTARQGRRVRYSRQLYAALISHDWPDNVRGLERFVTFAQALPNVQDLGLADLKELALAPDLVAGLEQAYARYHAAAQYAADSDAEQRLEATLSDRAASFFRQVFPKARAVPDANWPQVMHLSLDLIKEALAPIGFAGPAIADATNCFALLKAHGLEAKAAKQLLQRVFARLQATPNLWLSSHHLQPRYRVLESFFGLTHDALRGGQRRKSSVNRVRV